jgi:hypothetical protein
VFARSYNAQLTMGRVKRPPSVAVGVLLV